MTKFYNILKIQENLFYISVATEIINIISIILNDIIGLTNSLGIQTLLIIINTLYIGYMGFIILATRGEFQRVGFIVGGLNIISIILLNNPILKIVSSMLSVMVLVHYHTFLYVVLEKIKKIES